MFKFTLFYLPPSLFPNVFISSKDSRFWGTHIASPLRGADRQPQYNSNYTFKMALWFVSYATSPIIVIAYDVSLLLSMTYQFQRHRGKNCLHGSMGNKTDNPIIDI